MRDAPYSPITYTDPNGFGEGSDISGFATLSDPVCLVVVIYNHHDDWGMDEACDIQVVIEKVKFLTADVCLQRFSYAC